MNIILILEQTLNGLQLGVMLFLMAAGLTLVFGIMNLVNLAHGSFYMVGAYLATTFYRATGSFALGVLLGLAGTLVVGIVVERVALRTLYERDHLDQVLATFGLILFFNELMAILWGRAAIYATLPGYLSGHVELFAGLRRRSASTYDCSTRWCSASAPRSRGSRASYRARFTWCSRGWAS